MISRTLKEITNKIGSGATPRGGKNAYKGSGISLVRSQNVLDFEFDYDGLVFIDEEQAEKLNNVEIYENDILLNITGDSVARVCVVPDEILPARVNQHVMIIRIDDEQVDYRYIFYYLQFLKRHLLQLASGGATRKALTKTMVETLQILVPEMKVQKNIANILSSFDDKIENNNKIISNLEEQAQAIFKSWFVDFEFPNENGKPYNSNNGKMIDSEIGEIPVDWEVVELKDAFKQSKKTFDPRKNLNQDVLHFSIPQFDENKLPILENTNDIKSNKYILKENSVLFSKLNPRMKRVWYPNYNGNYLNVTSTEFVIVEANSEKEQIFLYKLIDSLNFQNYLKGNVTGTTGSRQRVSPKVAMSYKFPINKKIKDNYSEKMYPLGEKIKLLRNENEILAETRDALLPKLMSGEIRVDEASEVS